MSAADAINYYTLLLGSIRALHFLIAGQCDDLFRFTDIDWLYIRVAVRIEDVYGYKTSNVSDNNFLLHVILIHNFSLLLLRSSSIIARTNIIERFFFLAFGFALTTEMLHFRWHRWRINVIFVYLFTSVNTFSLPLEFL